MTLLGALWSKLMSNNEVAALDRNRNLYLSLLVECLIGGIYQDPPVRKFGLVEFEETLRDEGRDWPSVAHSMIGRKRMQNLRRLVENVIVNRVPGDLIETGVWRGGACILMKGVLAAYGDTGRRVWLADSFSGLPPPNIYEYPADAKMNLHTHAELSVSAEEVQTNFRRFGLLDDRVVFLKGWFRDTLPTAPIGKLSILRLDGDLYESTQQGLTALYDKVSIGGYVIVDDYHCFDACKQAVMDFCKMRGFAPKVEEIDGQGVFWRKVSK